MVCGSGLVEGPSICGAAVCVQLIGASTMAGCRGQKEGSNIRWLNCVKQSTKCNDDSRRQNSCRSDKTKEYTVIPLSAGRFEAKQTVFVFHHILRYHLSPKLKEL